MIVPIHGWLLDRAVEIDATHPGFAGHLFRASCERRHVVAAYLSRNQGSDCPQEMAAVGEFLMSAGHDDILRAAYGPIPPGLRGAISRGAKKVWPRRHYNYVYRKRCSGSTLRV